jgi:hypothetical protein
MNRKKSTTPTPTSRATPNNNPLTYDEAAQVMWIYYKDHKQLLYSSVSEAREFILTQLQVGTAVEEVFAPYMRPPKG